jgi:hypothetical protein
VYCLRGDDGGVHRSCIALFDFHIDTVWPGLPYIVLAHAPLGVLLARDFDTAIEVEWRRARMSVLSILHPEAISAGVIRSQEMASTNFVK